MEMGINEKVVDDAYNYFFQKECEGKIFKGKDFEGEEPIFDIGKSKVSDVSTEQETGEDCKESNIDIMQDKEMNNNSMIVENPIQTEKAGPDNFEMIKDPEEVNIICSVLLMLPYLIKYDFFKFIEKLKKIIVWYRKSKEFKSWFGIFNIHVKIKRAVLKFILKKIKSLLKPEFVKNFPEFKPEFKYDVSKNFERKIFCKKNMLEVMSEKEFITDGNLDIEQFFEKQDYFKDIDSFNEFKDIIKMNYSDWILFYLDDCRDDPEKANNEVKNYCCHVGKGFGDISVLVDFKILYWYEAFRYITYFNESNKKKNNI